MVSALKTKLASTRAERKVLVAELRALRALGIYEGPVSSQGHAAHVAVSHQHQQHLLEIMSESQPTAAAAAAAAAAATANAVARNDAATAAADAVSTQDSEEADLNLHRLDARAKDPDSLVQEDADSSTSGSWRVYEAETTRQSISIQVTAL